MGISSLITLIQVSLILCDSLLNLSSLLCAFGPFISVSLINLCDTSPELYAHVIRSTIHIVIGARGPSGPIFLWSLAMCIALCLTMVVGLMCGILCFLCLVWALSLKCFALFLRLSRHGAMVVGASIIMCLSPSICVSILKSLWPTGVSLLFTLVLSLGSCSPIHLCLSLLISFVVQRDLIRDFMDKCNLLPLTSLFVGFCLFLSSEALLFIDIFWAGFFMALCSFVSHMLALFLLDICELTYGNTLLLSTAAVSLGIFCISTEAFPSLWASPYESYLFACFFLSLQINEFHTLSFNVNDCVISCEFLVLSGLHFSHVLVGLILIGILISIPVAFGLAF